MHHRAKLTEHEVELIRQLCDEKRAGLPGALTQAEIAEKFEVHVNTVRKIAHFMRRTGVPADKRPPRPSPRLTAARCREVRLAFINCPERHAVSLVARQFGLHTSTVSWLLRHQHPAERREQ